MVTLALKKGGNHALDSLNGLGHRYRKYLRRKKRDKKRCKKCDKNRNKKSCRKCSNTYDIRGCVSCLDPPNHVHAVWDCDYIPQKELAETWELVTGDSFIVDIRKVNKPRWKYYMTKMAMYITKLSKGGSCVDMSGVHVVNSWGDGGYYKKLRMVCKVCDSYFMPLLYGGQVDDYDNDPVDFVELDDYG